MGQVRYWDYNGHLFVVIHISNSKSNELRHTYCTVKYLDKTSDPVREYIHAVDITKNSSLIEEKDGYLCWTASQIQ